MSYNTQLTSELRDLANSIGEAARRAGLDFFETIFELVDYKQLNEIAAYGGFPTRYRQVRIPINSNTYSDSCRTAFRF